MVSSDPKLRPHHRVSFLWPHFNLRNLPLFYQLPYTLPRTGRGVKRSVSTHRTPRGSRKSHCWQKNSWDHVAQLPGDFWGRLGRRGTGPWAWSGKEERQGGEEVKGREGKCVHGMQNGVTGSQQTDVPQHPGFFIHSFKIYHRKALCPLHGIQWWTKKWQGPLPSWRLYFIQKIAQSTCWAQSGLPAALCKVLLEPSHTCSSTHRPQLRESDPAAVSNCDRGHLAHKAPSVDCLALYTKSAQPTFYLWVLKNA